MRKREAEKLQIGDFVFAPGIGIYRNDQRRIIGIRRTDPDPKAMVPLFELEGEQVGRTITYLHLKMQQEVIRQSDTGVSVGDLARDAKDPHDIRS